MEERRLDFNMGTDCEEFVSELFYNTHGQKIPKTKTIYVKESLNWFKDTFSDYILYYDKYISRENSIYINNIVFDLSWVFMQCFHSDSNVTKVKFYFTNEESIEYIEKQITPCSRENPPEESIYLLIKDRYSDLKLKSYELIYDDSNFKLNYSDDFIELNDTIINNINSTKSGLYLFHGIQGTGKTSYIKHIVKNTKKKVIFMSSASIEMFTDSTFLDFILSYSNSIIIIEDGESLIMKRSEMNTNPVISSILNLTSGLTGDMLKLQFVVTFNCDVSEIDPALMRTGRLINSYEFKELPIDKSNNLLEVLGHPKQDKEMLLCDIYNFSDYILNNNTNTKQKIGYVNNI